MQAPLSPSSPILNRMANPPFNARVALDRISNSSIPPIKDIDYTFTLIPFLPSPALGTTRFAVQSRAHLWTRTWEATLTAILVPESKRESEYRHTIRVRASSQYGAALAAGGCMLEYLADHKFLDRFWRVMPSGMDLHTLLDIACLWPPSSTKHSRYRAATLEEFMLDWRAVRKASPDSIEDHLHAS